LFALVSLVWVGKIHQTKGSVGLPLTVLGIASLLVIWHAGSVSDRRGRKTALVPALGWSAAMLFLLGFSHGRSSFLVLMGLLGLGSGYAYPGPTSIVADVSTEEQRAVAVGGYRMAADVGALVGPAVAGVVAQVASFAWAFAALAAFVALSFLIALVARETLPPRAARPGPIRDAGAGVRSAASGRS
jgi:MFS family permease